MVLVKQNWLDSQKAANGESIPSTMLAKITARKNSMAKNPTPAERTLFRYLSILVDANKSSPFKFQKQKVLWPVPEFPFIVDAYMKQLKIAIEVDGRYHARTATRDSWRTEVLENINGIHVLRFWNEQVIDNPREVFEKLILDSMRLAKTKAVKQRIVDAIKNIRRKPISERFLPDASVLSF